MRDKSTVQYAEQRAAQATARARRHAAAAQRAEDAADAAQSKGWRTRRLREAERALRLMRKAVSEAKSWQAKAQTRRAGKAATSKRRAPRRAPSVSPDEEDFDTADEFIMAVNYREQSTPQASHVDIQMHVRREDGRKMTAQEARGVFAELRDTGVQTVPAGYEVAAVDWKRGRATRWRTGNVDEALGNFYSILLTVDPNKYDFRLGGLKE